MFPVFCQFIFSIPAVDIFNHQSTLDIFDPFSRHFSSPIFFRPRQSCSQYSIVFWTIAIVILNHQSKISTIAIVILDHQSTISTIAIVFSMTNGELIPLLNDMASHTHELICRLLAALYPDVSLKMQISALRKAGRRKVSFSHDALCLCFALVSSRARHCSLNGEGPVEETGPQAFTLPYVTFRLFVLIFPWLSAFLMYLFFVRLYLFAVCLYLFVLRSY